LRSPNLQTEYQLDAEETVLCVTKFYKEITCDKNEISVEFGMETKKCRVCKQTV